MRPHPRRAGAAEALREPVSAAHPHPPGLRARLVRPGTPSADTKDLHHQILVTEDKPIQGPSLLYIISFRMGDDPITGATIFPQHHFPLWMMNPYMGDLFTTSRVSASAESPCLILVIPFQAPMVMSSLAMCRSSMSTRRRGRSWRTARPPARAASGRASSRRSKRCAQCQEKPMICMPSSVTAVWTAPKSGKSS